MYTTETQPSDLIGLMNDSRMLRSKHGSAMSKIERMKHHSLVHRLNGKGVEWKRALKRAVNRTPKIRFPYGIEAAGVTTYSSLGNK